MEVKRKPELCDNTTCTGCGACRNACPVDAITMSPHNTEGFYRPTIDEDKCIRCFKCERSCPMITPVTCNEVSDDIYAIWNNSAEIRNESSSGGAFSALAQAVLDARGVVVGASYTDGLRLCHIFVEKEDGLKSLRASKYFQSDTQLVYREAMEMARQGRKVLFCGTPCQIAGFRGYMGAKKNENVILVDFICHGVPSPLFFRKYVKWLSSKYGAISLVKFRDKEHGWYDALRVIQADGKRYVLKGKEDSYWIGFNFNKCLQEACYNCKFLGETRNSDITIGDFWGLGKKYPFGYVDEIERGVSMVMLNTPKGKALFEDTGQYITSFRRSMAEVVIGNQAMIRPSSRPESRNNFYIDLEAMPFESFMKKYLSTDMKTRLVKVFREYLPRTVIEYIRKSSQK